MDGQGAGDGAAESGSSHVTGGEQRKEFVGELDVTHLARERRARILEERKGNDAGPGWGAPPLGAKASRDASVTPQERARRRAKALRAAERAGMSELGSEMVRRLLEARGRVGDLQTQAARLLKHAAAPSSGWNGGLAAPAEVDAAGDQSPQGALSTAILADEEAVRAHGAVEGAAFGACVDLAKDAECEPIWNRDWGGVESTGWDGAGGAGESELLGRGAAATRGRGAVVARESFGDAMRGSPQPIAGLDSPAAIRNEAGQTSRIAGRALLRAGSRAGAGGSASEGEGRRAARGASGAAKGRRAERGSSTRCARQLKWACARETAQQSFAFPRPPI